eukprot:6173479-Pleurochrysis_carterae.AAC.1
MSRCEDSHAQAHTDALDANVRAHVRLHGCARVQAAVRALVMRDWRVRTHNRVSDARTCTRAQ